MADITFDIDALKDAQKSINDLLDNLDKNNETLTSSLSTLKTDWNTKAGKKFFEEHSNWENSVELYVKKLTGVNDMLIKAIAEYDAIVNEVKNLSV